MTPGGKIKVERSCSTTTEANTEVISTVNITFDGASRNNGKRNAQAAAAAVLTNPEGRISQESQYLGNKTNNEAEFQAAIIGLKSAQEFGYKSVKLQGDSQLVVESLQGKRNIKAANLKPLYEEAKSLLNSFDKAEIHYIPREQNKAADALANQTLDNACRNTNYIGNSPSPPDIPSSTRNYAQTCVDKAVNNSYTHKDTVMVGGSDSWHGVTQNEVQETIQKQCLPIVDKLIEAKSDSDIVIDNQYLCQKKSVKREGVL
ncbi:MAG: ribonuclease HI family protein [Cyanobacteria bacterium J06573_2]